MKTRTGALLILAKLSAVGAFSSCAHLESGVPTERVAQKNVGHEDDFGMTPEERLRIAQENFVENNYAEPPSLKDIVQTESVVPNMRLSIVQDSNRFRKKRKLIPFSDVAGVSTGYLGKKSDRVNWYCLALTLRNGEGYPLFAPSRFFEGGSDRPSMAGRKRRLERYLES